MAVVYKLEFADGRCYVGRTTQDLRARVSQHARRETPVGRAMRRFGEVRVCVLETVPRSRLAARERHWIRALGATGPRGYNSRER